LASSSGTRRSFMKMIRGMIGLVVLGEFGWYQEVNTKSRREYEIER